MPSARIVANASSSAVAQSIVALVGVVASIAWRRSRPRSSFLWKVKPVGTPSSDVVELAQRARAARPSAPGAATPGGGGSGIGCDEVLLPASATRSACSSTVEVLLDHRFGRLVRRRSPCVDQRRRPQLLAHRRVRGDLLVHQRLRERRLVALVVAVAAVADQVDQEVAAEARAVVARPARAASRQATGSSALTWTIGILKPRARPLA